MRVLCLRFEKTLDATEAEYFLRWSPRVFLRAPHLIFLDLQDTAGLFGGEEIVLDKISRQAQELSPSQAVSAVLSDTPPGAQLLSLRHFHRLVPPGEESLALSKEPLSTLTELEGLYPWPAGFEMSSLIQFFQSLGFERIKDLLHLPMESLRNRWGALGLLLGRRLHQKDSQVISPLVAQEPLYAYHFFEHAIGRLDLLRNALESTWDLLFLRLVRRGSFSESLDVHLHCEYSKTVHRVELKPVRPSRDRSLITDLLFQKLANFNFQNPIKEIEIFVREAPEKIEQLDFFEPRDTRKERWERLISLSQALHLRLGFLKRSCDFYPEKAWHLEPWLEELTPIKDRVNLEEEAIQIKPSYGKELAHWPRPSLLLDPPRSLSTQEVSRLRFLTKHPVERLTGPWWDEIRPTGRDYFLVVHAEGRLWWIYREALSQKYFLHGAFD